MSFSLTLNFATLTELAAAIAKLGDVTSEVCVLTSDKSGEVKASPKPKAEKTVNQQILEKLKAAPADTAEAAPSPAPAPAAVVKTPAVDYPTLQKAVFELAGLVQKKGLDSAEHVLSIAVALGAPNFKGLDSAKWPEALAAVKAKTVEVAALEVEVA